MFSSIVFYPFSTTVYVLIHFSSWFVEVLHGQIGSGFRVLLHSSVMPRTLLSMKLCRYHSPCSRPLFSWVCVCVCVCARCTVYFLPISVSTLFSSSTGVCPLILGPSHSHLKPTDQPVMVCSVSNQETVEICMFYVLNLSVPYPPPTTGPGHGHLNYTDQPTMYGA